ncbi:MAG: hypothetical protein H6643_08440 [Caldilineaceae bacterium]|nr:hypothetical protein [Caldilineaceae bacterium]
MPRQLAYAPLASFAVAIAGASIPPVRASSSHDRPEDTGLVRAAILLGNQPAATGAGLFARGRCWRSTSGEHLGHPARLHVVGSSTTDPLPRYPAAQCWRRWTPRPFSEELVTGSPPSALALRRRQLALAHNRWRRPLRHPSQSMPRWATTSPSAQRAAGACWKPVTDAAGHGRDALLAERRRVARRCSISPAPTAGSAAIPARRRAA